MGKPSFALKLKGILQSNCSQLRVLPVKLDSYNRINLTVYSVVDPLLSCPKDIKEWQVVIPLIHLSVDEKYTIVLNSQEVTTI